ncbi:peptidyl-alpha-hydroxyglycine alpha-amidating lyase family protein [Galbibacter mesophilus]|uniref:peptidyl-alpha-hydroxyglycine alpha-amidating lyase family protein n=1 Tax=Galbibacter mesophilus TaxID=379069 RepID=UPI00191FB870|nr:peptidyl-alpha-hydroxyglycine alpha-amidating lyase family protein [Galbibacter mesophilus]MCM5663182.1 peptidyl-alpha-hydroxyglycine alpha-amidating lyase family protein [Galbibacter mesophilus]
MKHLQTCIKSFFILVFCVVEVGSAQQNNTSVDVYELVENWPKFPKGFSIGQPSGLGMDSQGNLIVFHRANAVAGDTTLNKIQVNTLLKINAETGEVIKEWGANLFCWPHGLTVDKDDNIWITDVLLHQVFKFDAEGNLLFTLGEEGIPGADKNHFNKPTDVAIAEDGSFYVGDGYGNSRIVKFSAAGDYIFEWGEKGTGKGQFNTPHSLDIDKDGNVVVADRDNFRIQIFSAEGKFLEEKRNLDDAQVHAVNVDQNNNALFSVDYLKKGSQIFGSNINKFNNELKIDHQWGRDGDYNGPVCRYHDIEIGSDGAIYVVDLLNYHIQKFKRINNTD